MSKEKSCPICFEDYKPLNSYDENGDLTGDMEQNCSCNIFSYWRIKELEKNVEELKKCLIMSVFEDGNKKNKEFAEHLQFIHDRLEDVHKENSQYDYMHKLRGIIKALIGGKE